MQSGYFRKWRHESVLPDGYQPLTIGRGISCAARRVPDRTALIAGDMHLTYRMLVRRMAQVANMARAKYGLLHGDRVALVAPNMLSYTELVAGLSDAGAIVATLSPRLTAPELRTIIADCDPRLIIVDPSLSISDDSSWTGDIPMLRLGKDYDAMRSQAGDSFEASTVLETDSFALAYTSGTTGEPKGVLLSHRSRALTFMAMAAEYGCFGIDDHFLAMAPMCHGAGFVFACAALFSGGTTELFDGGDPLAMLDRLGTRDVTGAFVVPTQLARLFDLSDAALDARRIHGLRTMISNASALAQPLKERAIEQFGTGILHETYGSTEGGIVTNIGPADLVRKPGSVGRPFLGVEVELRRADGSVADTDEPGELFSRSAASFNGYWNRPSETAETLVDGWVTVGDIATRDSDGFISIVDRKKDMVVSGGMNIYPREIETVIAGLPGVRDVAVVGMPNSQWGESLHAFIVPKSGAAIEYDAIIASCRAQLAGFKIPRTVSVVDELPRNAGGKVMKALLRGRAV
jgi:acyl-CoA synthetase (AMP-forming)/AMP-acid ligase II